mgnify:CR=1 FL=1
MSAHTPAPWKAEVNEKSATINILGLHTDYMRCRASDDHGPIVIVECASATLDDTTYAPMLPEQVANARLIAAAPELLESLKAMLSPRMDGPDSAQIWFAAEAVVAKAEGRT